MNRYQTFVFLLIVTTATVAAQDNYEIQVYGSDTVPKGMVMVETHTNFTFQGTKQRVGSMRPTNHALHETLEITSGWTDWFETGFYAFTASTPGYGYNFVGTHIRPRVRIPEEWKWPVGLSLSTEFGYQRPAYSLDTWTWEIRPIVDKELGKLYLCFNPAIGKSFHGASRDEGWAFAPNFKTSYEVLKRVRVGLEYYGEWGVVGAFVPFPEQGQQFLPAIDIDFGPNWEFNFGVGVGVTPATEHLIAKMIIGRRFSWGKRH